MFAVPIRIGTGDARPPLKLHVPGGGLCRGNGGSAVVNLPTMLCDSPFALDGVAQRHDAPFAEMTGVSPPHVGISPYGVAAARRLPFDCRHAT